MFEFMTTPLSREAAHIVFFLLITVPQLLIYFVASYVERRDEKERHDV